jgi:4'-phosphopantetheinyl transferase
MCHHTSAGRVGSRAEPAFQPAGDEVQCWYGTLDVPPEAAGRLCSMLAPDEQRRSERFRFEPDRRHYIVSRAVLRLLLARSLRIKPDELRFVHNAFGKPEIDPEFRSRITFNLSHSGGIALIAIGDGCRVGIDVEFVRRHVDYFDVAQCFFSRAEIDYLTALPDRLRADAFFDCWTKKEACVKACGGGLAIPLNSFSVPLTTDPAEVCMRFGNADAVACWSLYSLRPVPGYTGALAIEGPRRRLTQRQWQMARGELDI